MVACAALVLLMGCGTSRPRGFSTVTEVPPGSTSAQATSWQDARVGDRVEYAFYTQRGSNRGISASAGQLFVEVVSVQSPWVWLSIRITRNDGQPHPHPFLSHDFVLPMRMGQAPANPPDPIKRGTTSTSQQWAFAAGQHWIARRISRDDSGADGPMQHRLYATTPGPLYLTHGLLKADFSAFGFGYGRSTLHSLSLVSFQRGSGTPGGTAPAMDNPWGPGTWYETRERASWGDFMKRVCLGAEQGYLLRKVWEKPRDEVRCDDFQGAEVVSLEDALINLVNESVYIPVWPPRDYGAPLPRLVRVHLGQESVVAYFDEARAYPQEDSPWIRSRSYPIDLWSPVLQGLPVEVRFDRLSEGVYQPAEGGGRDYRSDSRLIRWGTWLETSELSTSAR